MANLLAQQAYEVIETIQPSLLGEIKRLLALGQTTKQITDRIATRDVALAGLVEMAIDYIETAEEQ